MKKRAFLRNMAVLAGARALTFGGLAATAGPAFATGAAAQADPLFKLSYPDVDGADHALAQWLGKPVVVNFWATWCPPCVEEMPDLEKLHQKYDGINFLGLGIDTVVNVKAFNEKVKVSYPLLLTGYAGIEIMRPLGNKAGGLPFTVIFDEHGQLAHRILGQIKPDDLDKILQEMVA